MDRKTEDRRNVHQSLFVEKPGNVPSVPGLSKWKLELRSFAEENRGLIESKSRELSSDRRLCRALTCAMYNFCYGRYVDSGGKVGLVFHPFLGYVRALQEVLSGREKAEFLESFESKAGRRNVAPLENLWRLGLYSVLPQTPDSKLMLDEVVSYARSVGSSAVK